MRIHVLGVGSIGTLLAYHLRTQRHADVALLLKARGIPGKPARPASPTGPVLGVERSGVYHSVSGFHYELVGPAIDSAVARYARTLTFPSSAHAARAQTAAARVLQDSSYVSADPIDSLIVALKCHHTLPVLRQLKHRLRSDSCITLVQNGMGVYDQLCDSLWPDPLTRPQFILASTTHGARTSLRTPKKAQATQGGGLQFERSVVHTGFGDIKLGVVPDPRQEVDYDQRLFERGEPEGTPYSLAMPVESPRLPLPSLSPSSDQGSAAGPTPLEATLSALLSLQPLNPSLLPMQLMYQTLLLKLAVNCAVNPVTGLLGVLNGALLGSPHTHQLISAILAECSAVITAYLSSLASPTTTSANHPTQPSLDPETTALFSPAALERRTLQVLTTTSRNTSSMASDMSRLGGGGGTEIEYINGYLVRLGDRMGVPTPVNKMMLNLVKAKDEIHTVSPGMVVRSPSASGAGGSKRGSKKSDERD
ncbi:hypothetical protein QFC19_000569 [Naganishia cerealis]|uniref:Uncharacterized protein n=1 Tax=Naganishia cerealis TaxID=610337 RepID=A0ACC2WLP4_9TREE|nr:hypothetical protein QFC19_000569 [Naganishia cerealis]